MIKNILTYSDNYDILSQVSEEVVSIDECKELIQDLKDTLNSCPTGAGLSAIQIGIPKRICFIKYGGNELILINPKIKWERRNKNKFKEGCLSIPNRYEMIERPQKVICEYLDENGNIAEIAEGGWMSAIIQHEIDHMNGISLLFDVVNDDKRD